MVQAIFIVFGLLLTGWGIWGLCDTESAWKMERFRRRANGLNDERTAEWETSNAMNGVLSIGFGVVLIVIGFIISNQISSREMTQTQALNELLRSKTVSIEKDGGVTSKIVVKDLSGDLISERRLSPQEEAEYKRNPETFMLKAADSTR